MIHFSYIEFLLCVFYKTHTISLLNHSFFLIGLWLLIFSVHSIGVLKLVDRLVDRAAGGNGGTDPAHRPRTELPGPLFDE